VRSPRVLDGGAATPVGGSGGGAIAQPRIGLVAACRFPAPRGSQVLIDEMATAFAAAGAETHLIAPMARRVGRPYRTHALAPRPGIAPPSDPIAWPNFARLLFDAALVARLDAVVRRERISVLHAHNYEALAAALIVRRLRRVPVVFHSHAMLADELPLYAPRGSVARRSAQRLGAWADRTLPRLADHVVALSDDVADYLADRGVARERLSIVPPGLAPAAPPTEWRGERPRRAVFAGNLDAYQNVDVLLDAWVDVRRRRADAELSVVTHAAPPALESAIARRRLQEAVRVVRARSFAEVSAEIASAAVGVSPRRSWSGFPIKTLNYMASGVPTVAFEASAKGIADGETGWVVRAPTAAALGAALCEALEDPVASARRGRAAREALHERHAWNSLAPDLLTISKRATERI
jgi:glycosyltransferase involved in cell wall biosynthesis